ncbi:MAG: hypothetical protein JW854_00600 [Actinobacteria bacterium]|nr:hypothetical protein [Actinomycetota bacterium]
MSAVRDYLKTLHLFTCKAFLSPDESPAQKVWFAFDDEGKVTGHSFEPADKEWDGSGPQPVIVPMGRFESEAKFSENWTEFIEAAEAEEERQRGG